MLRKFIVAVLRWIQTLLEPSDDEDFLAERKVLLIPTMVPSTPIMALF